ncbi:NAD-dependent succinate-semialdehyde dehydrogenase [Ponticaulis sp.]|uniref:NAD-dependent succinate-semialdehyde dehydrogenase n=1 Tax=Ponticaulis sp. TaxID=2020902 RepID=UPI000C44E5F3|nr:NAD-dependent succinate-semialdehyde dehydrogenase [Ponticaulis sp.]MAJ08507.1 succinate-semialdehyde dehydrogenase [Ponticaulis sp.]|tara:strand:- start:6690 stop:8069 length:1380 start_codon:yes stop_codon:yes gene_type:complete
MTELKTVNPTTGETLNTYPLMSDAEVAESVKQCHEAYLDWRLTSHEERAKIINKVAEVLRERKDEFAELMTKETGKLLSGSKQEIDLCAGICEYTAKNGPSELADETRDHPNGERATITYSPIGVVYGIQPWNFPCYQAIRYSIANLMAGNGVILKHAEACTGSGLMLRDVFEAAGLPKHLFTVLLIDHDQSDDVIENDLVRGVTLTGSDKAGKIVAKKAGEMLKKTVLELGSNDAFLVLDDADLDLAVKTSVTARIFNNGQTCVNGKRFIVTEKNYDAFVEKYTEAMKGIHLGDPMMKDTQLGPMSRSELRDDLHEQVKESVEKGAKILCGGEIPDMQGAWYPATVLVDVEPGQPAYDDELFGPVASVIKAKDDEDAMRIANDSRYGLGGGIFSTNVERAEKLAKTYFDTGMVVINGYDIAAPNLPFGGVKNSGFGREHGGFGMKEFVNAKAVSVLAA